MSRVKCVECDNLMQPMFYSDDESTGEETARFDHCDNCGTIRNRVDSLAEWTIPAFANHCDDKPRMWLETLTEDYEGYVEAADKIKTAHAELETHPMTKSSSQLPSPSLASAADGSGETAENGKAAAFNWLARMMTQRGWKMPNMTAHSMIENIERLLIDGDAAEATESILRLAGGERPKTEA